VTSPAAVAVFQELLLHGPLARAEVARRTGLSAGAVTKAAAPLLEAGYLEEMDAAPSRPGRPLRPMAVVPSARCCFGVKITPDRVHGVATDLTAGVLAVASARAANPSPQAVERAVRAVVARLRSRAPSEPAGLGVGVSGDVDTATGVVRDSPLMGWTNVPLGRQLADLGPVIVDNDVQAFTLGEWMFGPDRGADSLALVTIGSGIGCGLVVGGRQVHGAYGIAGELGHLPVAPGHLVCRCGRRSCVETVASSGAIASLVADAAARPGLDFAAAVDLARSGDRLALAAMQSAGEAIGLALACLVNLVGPASIVVAGEGVDAFDLYRDTVERVYAAHAFGAARRAPIRAITHSFNDWARGAAVNVIWAIARGR
jgi:predicted NBD/HSP70 family sugar kinase